MKITQTKIIIFLVLLVIMFSIYFSIDFFENWKSEVIEEAYNNGLSDGQIMVISEQTTTGNIFLIYNESIISYPIEELCRSVE
ncbi:MAG: hypothetical protein KKF56_05610 [Nanoarchaeota archaeon]|nr:hypothetical protein [Nanoarchaeota archaeon]